MKFRGLISDESALKDFMYIVNSLSKLSKECVLRFLPNKIYFIVTQDDQGPRRPFVWCELLTDHYFREYIMSGVSEEMNEIYLSFSPVMLSKSLTSIKQGAKSLKIKLTNKQTPCLTLEIDMAKNETTRNAQYLHDISVQIITKKYWGDFKEPNFKEFHVSLQLPSFKPVRNMVERMKTMSQYLILSASRNGRVTLKIETNLANVSAHFHSQTVHSYAGGMAMNEDTELASEENDELVSVSIDIKKLVAFLTALHFMINSITCSIVHNNMAKFTIQNGEHMKLHCFLTEFSP